VRIFTENKVVNPILLQGVEIKQETKKALLVQYTSQELWLPISQLEWFDQKNNQIKASEWILKKHNLI